VLRFQLQNAVANDLGLDMMLIAHARLLTDAANAAPRARFRLRLPSD
jgi:hypothetical protein